MPNRVRSWSQPSTQPGTDQLSGPCVGDLRRAPCAAKTLDRRGVRGPAAGVEAVELLRLRVPDDGEQVAADAARHRLDDAEHGVGGDGGVDRVAALLEDADRGGRRQRLARRGHAVPGQRRPTASCGAGRLGRSCAASRPTPATIATAKIVKATADGSPVQWASLESSRLRINSYGTVDQVDQWPRPATR